MAMISFNCLASVAEPLLTQWASLTAGGLRVENLSSLNLSLVAIGTLGTYLLVRRDREAMPAAEVKLLPTKRISVASLEDRPPTKKAA